MHLEANFNPECQFIPGYTGFCPEEVQHIGSSYGRITQEAISGRHNYLTQRLSPTKCYPDGCLKPTICEKYTKTCTDRKDHEHTDIKITEFKTDPCHCGGSFQYDFEVVKTPDMPDQFPSKFRTKFTDCGSQPKRSPSDCDNYHYTSEFITPGSLSDTEKMKFRTSDRTSEDMEKTKYGCPQHSLEKEFTRFGPYEARFEKELRDKKNKIIGDPAEDPCDGYCQRINYSSMRAAGLPSDWSDVKADEKAKLKKERKLKETGAIRCPVKPTYYEKAYKCIGGHNEKHMKYNDYHDGILITEEHRHHVDSPVYAEASEHGEGFPVSLTIHIPNCKPTDKIEIPKLHRGYQSELKKFSSNSPCIPKKNIVHCSQKHRMNHPKKFSSENVRSRESSYSLRDNGAPRLARYKSSETGAPKGHSSEYLKSSTMKCPMMSHTKVIPKYTGYITGLRWTYGETYGKAAERLLGNRPECLEKYVVCDNYMTHPDPHFQKRT